MQYRVWKIISTVFFFFRENERKKLSLWGSVEKFDWFLSKYKLQICQNCIIHVLRSLLKICFRESFQISYPPRKKCKKSLTLTKNFRHLYHKCILHVQFNVNSKKTFFLTKKFIFGQFGTLYEVFSELSNKILARLSKLQPCFLVKHSEKICFLEDNDLFVILPFRPKTSIYIAEW